MKITAKYKNHLICTTESNLEVLIPFSEISWSSPSPMFINNLIGQTFKIRIIDVNSVSMKILGSIRKMEEDPWPIIHKKLPKGTKFTGNIVEIHSDYVKVDIGNGLLGCLDRLAG